MNISFEKIYDKGISEINEDELLAEKNIFAVFDGAFSTFKDEMGKTGGKIAAEILKNTFSKNIGSLRELAIEANKKIFNYMESKQIDISKKKNLWTSAAAVVRIKENYLEYFQIGDSLIFIIFKNGKHKLLTKYYDQDIPALLEWKKQVKKGEKNIREKVLEKIMESRKKINVDFGFINGEEDATKFFNTGKIELKNIENIILFTDGLLLPKENPEEKEDWNKFVKIYKKSGLGGLLKYVRETEESDPKCYLYPRFKKHDDVAAISIKIE